MNKDARAKTRMLSLTAIAWILIVILLFPFIWMLFSSFKGPTEILSFPPTIFPKQISLVNYQKLFAGDFLYWLRNSLVVAFSTVVLVITLSTLGAYSITRFNYPGRSTISVAVLITYLFPPVLMLIPLLLIISAFQIADSYLALIIANTTFALPFSMWLLRSYFLSVPIEVEEAAMVDGASRARAFFEVVLPQVSPGIISTATFTFILAWDDYLFASTFTSSNNSQTLPVGIARYADELSADWGVLMAAAVAITVPVLVLFAILQARLIPNLNAGAVKT